jgi:8-oxo-dGTP diphosphatase
VSSPALRCVQTVAPLASRLGIDVERVETLRREGDAADLRTLVLALSLDPTEAVICTHGELMRPLLAGFRHNGTLITSAWSDDDWLLAKGTFWTLTTGPGGRILAVDHRVPSALPSCIQHA